MLVLVRGALGAVLARRAFCRSTRRTLASDPGSGIIAPSPDLTPESPAVLPGVVSAAPKSIRNLAIFPGELYIPIHCREPSPLWWGSKSKPTDVSSDRRGSIAKLRSATRLHPGNNTRATAAVQLAGHRIIDDNYRRLVRELLRRAIVITIRVESAGLPRRLDDPLPRWITSGSKTIPELPCISKRYGRRQDELLTCKFVTNGINHLPQKCSY
jgi:hypothetical protein